LKLVQAGKLTTIEEALDGKVSSVYWGSGGGQGGPKRGVRSQESGAGSQGVKESRSLGVRESGSQGVRESGSQGVKESGSRGVRESGRSEQPIAVSGDLRERHFTERLPNLVWHSPPMRWNTHR